MKYARNIIVMTIAVFCFFSLMIINGKAEGPRDGEIVDGSLLTSNERASDEKPLILEGVSNGIVPYGTYLSNGVPSITDRGNGVVYISGQTNCYRTSDKVQIYLYLERLTGNGWNTIKTHYASDYNTYKVNTGMSFSVSKGYYYRVKGTHIAKKGSTTESCTTCTSAIYIG